METNQIPVEQPIVTTPAPIVPETVSQAYIPVTQKSSNLPIIILSIFLVISLSAIAYLYTQIQSLKTQAPTPVAQVTPSPVVTPVATSTPAAASAADPTATWTTYTNSTFGFSFQLPKEVSYKYDDLDKYVETGINNAQLLVQNFDGMKAGGDGDSDFQIMILIENSNGLNMEDISSPKKTTISNNID